MSSKGQHLRVSVRIPCIAFFVQYISQFHIQSLWYIASVVLLREMMRHIRDMINNVNCHALALIIVAFGGELVVVGH